MQSFYVQICLMCDVSRCYLFNTQDVLTCDTGTCVVLRSGISGNSMCMVHWIEQLSSDAPTLGESKYNLTY